MSQRAINDDPDAVRLHARYPKKALVADGGSLGGDHGEAEAVETAQRSAAGGHGVDTQHRRLDAHAADQVGVLGEGSDATMLTKADDRETAVAQLGALGGPTRRLVNGVVVRDEQEKPHIYMLTTAASVSSSSNFIMRTPWVFRPMTDMSLTRMR